MCLCESERNASACMRRHLAFAIALPPVNMFEDMA